MHIDYLYRCFRRSSPFMLVGENARLALDAARTLDRWRDLENAGLVRIRSEYDDNPDASFYDTWPHLSQRSRDELVQRYYDDCWGVITECRADAGDEWHHADSIWGNSGYKNVESPFENPYVVDLMRTAIAEHERMMIGSPLSI